MIDNINEPWQGHSFEEVEDFIKEELLDRYNKACNVENGEIPVVGANNTLVGSTYTTDDFLKVNGGPVVDWNETDNRKASFIENKPNLKPVATSGNYNDLINKPVNVSAFTNDSGYLTSSSLTPITEELSEKQDNLVSGVTIRTVNNKSLLGAGDIEIPKGKDAVNPFKGWFSNLQSLNDTYASPSVGDYAYIQNADPSQPASIYVCVTEGRWSNGDRTVSTANINTFETGEPLNEVGIDDTNLENPKQGYIPKASDVKPLKDKLKDVTLTEELLDDEYTNGSYIKSDGTIPTATPSGYLEANIEGFEKIIFIGVTITNGQTGYAFYDSNDEVISSYRYDVATETGVKEYELNVPSGAVLFRWTVRTAAYDINGDDTYIKGVNGKSIQDLIDETVDSSVGQVLESMEEEINTLSNETDALKLKTKEITVEQIEKKYDREVNNYYIKGDGSIQSGTPSTYFEVNVEGYKRIKFTGTTISSIGNTGYAFYDVDGEVLYSSAYDKPYTVLAKEYELDIPPEAMTFRWTVRVSAYDIREYDTVFFMNGKTLQDIIDESIDEAIGKEKEKEMTVVCTSNANSMRVHSKFNKDLDLVITMQKYPLTGNTSKRSNVSFAYYYLGPNTYSLSQITTEENKIGKMIADMFGGAYTLNFGPIHSQHGYTIVKFNSSNHGLTQEYVNSLWEDQLNRQFHIGKIEENYLYLIPTLIITDEGYEKPSYNFWESDVTAPNLLTYVSGGPEGANPNPINGTQSRFDLPIEVVDKRVYIVDGEEVPAGTYNCDNFIIREEISGKKPWLSDGALPSDWFSNEIPYAGDLVKWVRTFDFHNCICTVSQSFNVVYPFQIDHWYGLSPILPLQQEYDGVTYNSTTFIPKVKRQEYMEFESNIPSSGNEFSILRNTTNLYDINYLPDRVHTILHTENSDRYLLGMAGGYSTQFGAGKSSFRNEYVTGPNDEYVLQWKASLNNKAYPRLLEGSNFTENEITTDFAANCNTYFSWFDPNDNPGQQVYWYKENDYYILLCHSSELTGKQVVKLPPLFEGMSVMEIMDRSTEETAGKVELLTDVVLGGQLIIDYKTAGALKYIVMKLR